MCVILRLSNLKLLVHEKFYLCMQYMGRKLMSAVLFGIKFLKVCKFQHTCALFSYSYLFCFDVSRQHVVIRSL